MGFPNKNFRQRATIWRVKAIDAYGKPEFFSPEVLPCRWQQGAGLFIDTDGSQQEAAATVYINDNSIKVGDYVYNGNASTYVGNPTEVRNAWPVKRVIRSPRLKSPGNLTKVLL